MLGYSPTTDLLFMHTRPSSRKSWPKYAYFRSANLPPEQVVATQDMRVTTPARTAADITRWYGLLEGIVAFDSIRALHPTIPFEQICQEALGTRIYRGKQLRKAGFKPISARNRFHPRGLRSDENFKCRVPCRAGRLPRPARIRKQRVQARPRRSLSSPERPRFLVARYFTKPRALNLLPANLGLTTSKALAESREEPSYLPRPLNQRLKKKRNGKARTGLVARPGPTSYFFFGSSVDSAATKASCGTVTDPMAFIRFLPAFCFSSSLRLREMSPP